MKIQDYKKRFDLLLESKMGNVKPLISEDDYQGQSSDSTQKVEWKIIKMYMLKRTELLFLKRIFHNNI